jgi:histidinol phosphatase-like enzyme
MRYASGVILLAFLFPGSALMLYIFDLDATLVTKFGETPLPGVPEMLNRLSAQGAQIAVATNQAGPAWGKATGEPRYPQPSELGARFTRIAVRLPQLATAPWFVAVGDARLPLDDATYESLIHEMRMAAGALVCHISAALTWRKPEPGMLLAACDVHQTTPDQAIFVGDADTDHAAAVQAGMEFVFTERFFGWRATDDGG